MSNVRSADSWRSARKLFLRSLLSILVGCVLLAPAKAQFVQQGSKLVGGAIAAAHQGTSVSVSRDGNTILVGGPTETGPPLPAFPSSVALAGAAWIFTRSGGTWGGGIKLQPAPGTILPPPLPEETGSGQFGFSVALSADGNTAIVGAPHDHSDIGAAWIFTKSGGSWSEQAGPLVGSDASATAERGWSVAISGDGDTAIVGGPYESTNVGAVWVWTRSSGSWSQQGGTLVGSGGVTPSYQGTSVALSSDGNTAIMGGWADNSDAGAAWVWTRSGSTWSQVGSKLVGAGASSGAAQQGTSVGLSLDGNTAIVGGPADNGSIGAVWIFTQSGGAWTQQGGKLSANDVSGAAQQGQSVALSLDGSRAIVGGPYDTTNGGAAWVWTRAGSTWSKATGGKLMGTGAAAARQGWSVAISGGGNTAVAGGPTDTGNVGATWVYAAPDLTITNAHNDTFHRGDLNRTYTITVTNAGDGPTDGSTVTVADTIPSGLTNAVLGGGGWGNCATTTDSTTHVTTASCNRTSTLSAGASYPDLTLTVNVSSSAPSGLSNFAKVSGGGELDTSNDGAADLVTLPAVPDLAVSLSHSGALYKGRTGVAYTIRVSNVSTNASTSGTVTMTIALPAGLTNPHFTAGGAWSCSNSTLICTNGDTLAVGSSYVAITLTVDVTSDAPSSVSMTANVSGGGDVYTSNNSATDTAAVASTGPDLTISSSHLGTFKRGQTNATYVIAVSNVGGGPSGGAVTVTDTLPTYLAATAIDGGRGWKCTLASVSCTRNDPLPAGLSYHFITLTVTVSGSAPAPVVVSNSATVAGGSEGTTSNDTASDVTLITP